LVINHQKSDASNPPSGSHPQTPQGGLKTVQEYKVPPGGFRGKKSPPGAYLPASSDVGGY